MVLPLRDSDSPQGISSNVIDICGIQASDEWRKFSEVAKNIICMFNVFTSLDKPAVGNRCDAHTRGFGRSDASQCILNNKASLRREPQFSRCLQINIWIWLTAFNFIS